MIVSSISSRDSKINMERSLSEKNWQTFWQIVRQIFQNKRGNSIKILP